VYSLPPNRHAIGPSLPSPATPTQSSLDYFAARRTDLRVSNQFQGVQTPSQGRYVDYMHQIISEMGGVCPAAVPLTLATIRVHGLAGTPACQPPLTPALSCAVPCRAVLCHAVP